MKLGRDIACRRRRAVLNVQRSARGFLGRKRAEKTRLNVITRIQASTSEHVCVLPSSEHLCVLAICSVYSTGVSFLCDEVPRWLLPNQCGGSNPGGESLRLIA